MRHGERDEGAAAVEFALVLPVLALILFAIIQFGLVFLETQGVEGAAREAAREGSVGGTLDEMADGVVNALSGLEGDLRLTVAVQDSLSGATTTYLVDDLIQATRVCSGASSACTTAPCSVGDQLTVTVDPDEDFEIVIPLWGNSQIDYVATATFRCETT